MKPARGKPISKLQKPIAEYHAELAELARQNVLFEGATSKAFSALLTTAGRMHDWTLIPQLEHKADGRRIRPDGTFKDSMSLVRGFWEAKDTGDDLDTEIAKKRKAGYPTNNIIFEDTATAVLYQSGAESMRVDMKDAHKLEGLVVQFFRHTEPQIEKFEEAVEESKERVPELAAGLKERIEEAHNKNPAFKKAFADFFELCRASLNPNLSEKAVDEMLIQHILTERLIREIFDNPEFVRRNVIAAEVEKVMLAMTSQSFDRNTYLKKLDRFYVAIEMAARTMTDFSDKQHFLNTVYERFFQGYSVKLADTMGIVYTPQEIVDFMCASVEEVLKTEFGKTLASDDVYIIDPCTGTGNFIVNLIRRIPKAKLEDVYKHRLFANEIMLLPYYIAALNIEHAYFEQMGTYAGFEGLCFVDSLDMAEHAQSELSFMTAVNSARVRRQREAPITIVIGNPPYNASQVDESDNNKNRTYPVIDKRIKDTYIRLNSARKTKLYDPYVKFFRWASDRLGNRDGIVCLITNNSFLHQSACDGLQKSLSTEFTHIYHLDLRGNVRQNPTLSGTAYNVFRIQVGVGITIAVRRGRAKSPEIDYHAVPLDFRRLKKLEWVGSAGSVGNVEWMRSHPDQKLLWLPSEHEGEFSEFTALGSKVAKASEGPAIGVVFQSYSLGASTNRDAVAYAFGKRPLMEKVDAFAEAYNAELDRYRRRKDPKLTVDEVVDHNRLKWSRNLKRHLENGDELSTSDSNVRTSLYRPFTRMSLYLADIVVDELGQMPRFLPIAATETENALICVPTVGNRAKTYSPFVTHQIPNLNLTSLDAFQCFSFYVYDEDGSNRRENITDWALKHFRDHYKDKKIHKWSIFHYVYGLLHHPGYSEKFADNLKKALPRIPFAPDFRAFAEAGKTLATFHLDYEKQKEWELDLIETPGVPLSYRVEDKMRLSKGKTRLIVNPSLTLAGIPPEAFEYRLGNRSALDWVIDQYQVSTDKRSGITSDPNREDDPQYIVRLVGQVIRVSVETVKIVNGLPPEFSTPAA